MRELTRGEMWAMVKAYNNDGLVASGERRPFERGFTAGLDYAAGEVDRLRHTISVWKRAAKKYRRSRARKQEALKWGLAEIDRLRAALEPFAKAADTWDKEHRMDVTLTALAVARQALEVSR